MLEAACLLCAPRGVCVIYLQRKLMNCFVYTSWISWTTRGINNGKIIEITFEIPRYRFCIFYLISFVSCDSQTQCSNACHNLINLPLIVVQVYICIRYIYIVFSYIYRKTCQLQRISKNSSGTLSTQNKCDRQAIDSIKAYFILRRKKRK